MLKSIICTFLILLFTVLIETSIFSNLLFLPAIPDFVLICSLYISLITGKVYGEVAGFTSGVLLDFVSGAPFGFNCIFRTIIGYVAGIFGKSLNYKGFLMPALIGLIATFSKVLLIWIISLFFQSIINYNLFSFTFLFELIFNVLLTPFIFKFLNCFYHILTVNGEDNF